MVDLALAQFGMHSEWTAGGVLLTARVHVNVEVVEMRFEEKHDPS